MRKEILIIDDDESSRFIMKEIISRTGYSFDIHEAHNGESAITFLMDYEEKLVEDSITEQVCMLIFLDINMPIMNGFEFIKEFVALSDHFEKIKPVTVFMITSSENPRDIQKVNEIKEIEGFVLKYPQEVLLKKIIKKSLDMSDEVNNCA